MNRQDFGQLIASLRQELGWTQFQLAEYAEMDENALSTIERGAKKHLDPELLLRLANALQLTSLERREFFLGASGIEQEHLVRQPGPNTPTQVFDPQAVINDLLGLIRQIQLPVYLGDAFGDILAFNQSLLEIFQVDPATLKALTLAHEGFSNLHFVYGTLQSQQALGKEFSETAIRAIRAFREGSLRYRSKPRYIQLNREFRDRKKYPLLERYWRRTHTLENDKESMREFLEIQHPRYGKLHFSLLLGGHDHALWGALPDSFYSTGSADQPERHPDH